MDEPRISCENCGTDLHDPPEAPSGKSPCPKCGATERVYTVVVQPGEIRLEGGRVDVSVHPATVETRASVPTPTVKVSDPTR